MTIRVAARSCAACDPDAFDLRTLGLAASVMCDGNREELCVGAWPTAVRVSVEVGTVLAGPVRLTYRVEGRQHLARRLLALRQWEALGRLGRVPRPLSSPCLNPDRALMLIKTLDALAYHSNTHEVAVAVFGADVVARDWHNDSDYLRMKTRRLIGSAWRLVAGGYRAILARGH